MVTVSKYPDALFYKNVSKDAFLLNVLQFWETAKEKGYGFVKTSTSDSQRKEKKKSQTLTGRVIIIN